LVYFEDAESEPKSSRFEVLEKVSWEEVKKEIEKKVRENER
jgi:hypothetical protein